MNKIFNVILFILLSSVAFSQGTPPQIINKACSANTFFSQIQPGPGHINCTQPSYSGLSGLPSFIDSIFQTGSNVMLLGDLLTPGSSKYYGTDPTGLRGWYSISSEQIAWGSIIGTLSNQTDLQTALNAKQNTLTVGNLTDAGTDGISVSNGTGAVIGSGTSLSQHVSDTTHAGYLSSTDWNTFNGKQASGVAVTSLASVGTSPNASAGTIASQVLTLQPASGTNPGVVTSGSQTLGGIKTFTSAPNFSSLTASQALVLDSSNNVSSLVFTSFPSVSSIVSRDASANTQVNGLLATTAVVAGALVPNAATVAVNGMYLPATNTVGISTNSINRLSISTTTSTFTTPLSATNLSGTNTGDVTLGTANGLSLSSQVLSLAAATTSVTGALTSTDWNTFNGKQAAGSYITSLTSDVVASGPGAATSTIQPNVVSNSKLAQMGANTIKGNNTAGTANAADLTVAQTNTILGDVTTLAAVGSTPSANGGSISGNTLTLQPADSTHPGIIANATQQIPGFKNFTSSTFGGNNTLQAFSTRSGVFQVQTSSANRVSSFINENNTSGANVVVGLNTAAAGSYGFPNSGNALGFITFAGANNTTGAYSQSANISVTAGSTWSNTNFETNYALQLVPSGSTNPVTVHAISSVGAHTLGATSTTPQHSLNTATATPGSGTGTITNLPTGFSGNPTGYIQITINGVNHVVPFW